MSVRARTSVVNAIFAAVISASTSFAQFVNYELVPVGDAGNTADTTGYGAVPYEYQIGKYEVTIGQYTAFLNAVDPNGVNLYGLYKSSMQSDLQVAGISFSAGQSAGSKYAVLTNDGSSANRPITRVSWFDAARFANWMQNGQGSGSTETGAYTLNGATTGTAPARNPGAQFYIPTENEWYKAAYYSPSINSGSGGYYLYATQSDAGPGNIIGAGGNRANYNTGVYSVTQSSSQLSNQNYLTNVGAFSGSPSAYGTFDQSGNVFEWNDLTGTAGTSRAFRGGAWNYSLINLSSADRTSYDVSNVRYDIGFRLATPAIVPEPSTYAMALAGLACGGYSIFRRRKRV